jgi:class 3 adenylate cyclase
VAYQLFGTGAIDLVVIPDGFMTIEAIAEYPLYARLRDRLASFSRTIILDRRGLGLSDPAGVKMSPTLEDWAEDVDAVADAVSASSVALLGIAEGAFTAVFYAASHPRRVSHLVLVNATPGYMSPPFCDWGEVARFITPAVRAQIAEGWRDVDIPSAAPFFAPSAGDDPGFHEWLARYGPRSASPSTANALFDILMWSDIRSVLPIVRVPTLVIHRSGNRWFTPEHGRFLAEQIAGARYVELPGADHVPFLGDSEAIAAEIEEFVTGTRSAPVSDRVLATVLFTDMVVSTEHLTRLGDRAWRQQLDRHDAMVRDQLEAFRGREISTAGDSFFASFDGPAKAIGCAHEIIERASAIGIDVRAGVHTGECEVRGNDLAGIAVHIGARVAALAAGGEILTTGTVKDLVAGSGINFTDHGIHKLKGIPEPRQLYRVDLNTPTRP